MKAWAMYHPKWPKNNGYVKVSFVEGFLEKYFDIANSQHVARGWRIVPVEIRRLPEAEKE